MATTTSDRSRTIFGFPDPVNEIAARIVAGVVAIGSLTIALTGWHWLFVPLAYGFWARVLTGPRLSPLGRAAVAAAPRLTDPRPVPGPPKRFAQGVGATLSTAGLVAWLVGAPTLATGAAAAIAFAATLESVLAICLGCHMFTMLMRIGVIPESVCRECADINRRSRVAA